MKTKSLMILGTSSGAGKSLVTAGFCRLFSDWGFRVAPFKAQNMANNSCVTAEGGEMGRAQAVQAECARIQPHTDMNPILLKPASDNGSQVIMQGKAVGHFKAADYFSKRQVWARAIQESYARLAARYEVIVLEGAGSPAEINLKEKDLVNFYSAEMADARCLLVADIDRGGIFASVIGTFELLTPEERDRIDGIIINKFRGDISLFRDGIEFIEKRTGKKVIGVLPYDRDLWLEEEDSVFIGKGQSGEMPRDVLDIAVIHLPRMSNFTDFEMLRHENGVRLRYVKSVRDLGHPDLLILPGTKATIADLEYLKEKGFAEAVRAYAASGGRILGVCGGFQMMGKTILDGKGIESAAAENEGFGFFDMVTEFEPEKVLRQVRETVLCEVFGSEICGYVEGYEIHMGKSRLQEKMVQGIYAQGNFAGTYYHGLFDSPDFRESFLQALARSAGKTRESGALNSAAQLKEQQYARLRNLLAAHLDLDYVKKCLDLTPVCHDIA